MVDKIIIDMNELPRQNVEINVKETIRVSSNSILDFDNETGKLKLITNGKVVSEVDLPTEKVISNAYYDDETKELVINFENSNEIRIPIDFTDEIEKVIIEFENKVNNQFQEINEKIELNKTNINNLTDKAKTLEEKVVEQDTNISNVQTIANEALAIAKGRTKASVFETYLSMVEYLKSATNTEFNIGDNLLIKELGVPDYWVSAILEDNSGYYGYYEVSLLETEKIDLTNYYNIPQSNELLNKKADKKEIPTKVSDLTNDLRYTTEEYVEEAIANINVLDAIEITYDELVALRDSSQLKQGQTYIITDYQCTTTTPNTRSDNHQFDIILIATSENTLSELAKARKHEGDTYFQYSNLNEWKLKYSLDNDTSRFAWADAVNGKGVIYYMKDEWNNEVPYDFKNIVYQVKKSFEYYHTGTAYLFSRNEALDTIINDVQYYGYTCVKTPTAFPNNNCLVKDDIVTISTVLYNLDGSLAPNFGSSIRNINDGGYEYYTFNFIIGNENNYEITSRNYVENYNGVFAGCKENKITEVGEGLNSTKLILNNNYFEYACAYNELISCSNNLINNGTFFNKILESDNNNIDAKNSHIEKCTFNSIIDTERSNISGVSNSKIMGIDSKFKNISKLIILNMAVSSCTLTDISSLTIKHNIQTVNTNFTRSSDRDIIATYFDFNEQQVTYKTIDGGESWEKVETTGGSLTTYVDLDKYGITENSIVLDLYNVLNDNYDMSKELLSFKLMYQGSFITFNNFRIQYMGQYQFFGDVSSSFYAIKENGVYSGETTLNLILSSYKRPRTETILATQKYVSDNTPTKISQLENDSDFTTNEYVNNLLSNFSSLNLQVVSILPTENISTSTIYLLATNDTKENNVYEEWIYVNNKWELIGSTKVELPTKISQLENDRNFIDNTVNNLINYYNKNESDDRYLNSPNFTGTVNIGGVTKLDGYAIKMYHPTDGAFYNVIDLNFRLSGGAEITGNDENVIMFDDHNKFSKIFNGSCFFNKIIPLNMDSMYVEDFFDGSIGEAQKQWTNIYGKNIYQDGKKVATSSDLDNYVTKDGFSMRASTNTALKLYYDTGNGEKSITLKSPTITLPTASSSTLGGVKVGSNITVSNGTISLSKTNVTNALGYTPPTSAGGDLYAHIIELYINHQDEPYFSFMFFSTKSTALTIEELKQTFIKMERLVGLLTLEAFAPDNYIAYCFFSNTYIITLGSPCYNNEMDGAYGATFTWGDVSIGTYTVKKL